MSESAILQKIQEVTGLPTLLSDENHLPLNIHLQRMMATPVEKQVLCLFENGELIGLNLAHANLSDKDLDFLKEFTGLRTLNLTRR